MTNELVARAVFLQRQGSLDEAEQLYRRVLRELPDHAGVLEALGVLSFGRGQVEEAADLFRRGVASRPNSALMRANLGEALRLLGRREEAYDQLRSALKLDPRLAQAWNSLGLLAHDQGRYADSEAACREAIRLRPRYAAAYINLGNALGSLHRRAEAALALRTAVMLEPHNPIALTNLGQNLSHAGDSCSLDEAGLLCRRAVSLAPHLPQALSNLGNVLFLQGCVDEAIEYFHRALQPDPAQSDPATRSSRPAGGLSQGLPQAHHGLGLSLLEQGKIDKAESCFREALRLDPALAVSWIAIARLQAERGDFEQSCQSARSAIALGSELAEGYWRLAINLRDRLPEDELGLMRALVEGKGLSDTQRALLNFGLAAVLDAQGHYSQAAVHLESANALQATAKAARGLKYDPQQHHQFIDRMIASFSSDFLARRRGWGDGDPRPVFVVGLPRSGTTLTEQILASHRQVHGAGELNEVHRVFRTLSEFVDRPDRDPFDALDNLTPESTKAAARSYLEKLDSLAPGTARRVVDKMPDNFRLIGLITLLWPSARVIVCGRDLRDIALSCWQTGFERTPWTNDWENIARRLADFQRMMNHWQRTRPFPCLHIAYEQLVIDLEAHARRLIDFVGLDWDPACLDFHTTQRVVRTASLLQVRQPLYTRSVGRWRHYEASLQPFFQACERLGVVLGDGLPGNDRPSKRLDGPDSTCG